MNWGVLLLLVMANVEARTEAPCAKLLRKSPKSELTELNDRYKSIHERLKNELEYVSDSSEFVLRSPNSDSSDTIQFGFESEYTTNNWSANLLDHYVPDSSLVHDLNEWDEYKSKTFLNEDIRMMWVRANLRRLFQKYKKKGKLVLRADSDLTFLPASLILDETGNLEIVGEPVDTLERFEAEMKEINEIIGAGSMQGSVSVSYEALKKEGPKLVERLLGYFQFFSDFDLLHKLVVGASRYVENPEKEVAKTFQHKFLGPMTRKKREDLHRVLSQTLENGDFNDSEMDSISASDKSFKYLGTTVYRPDVVRGRRALFEVRDAHSSGDILMDRVLRMTYYLKVGFSDFEGLSKLPVFDSKSDFDKFSEETRESLQRIFPVQLTEGMDYDSEELFAIEVFRNFAFPMRDWEGVLDLLGATKNERKSLIDAQSEYKRTITFLADQFHQGEMSSKEASVAIQGALANFSVRSGIFKVYLRWWNKALATRSNKKGVAVWTATPIKNAA
ncbi:MAG: hypothetical protein KDD25_05115 [Bdellovibrionales bacterium]|nr:hypothetical protein [Bdellovibrionales bacterium]